MDQSGSGDDVIESLKGKAKETVGALREDESLKQEGQAQQDKAEADRDEIATQARHGSVRPHE